MALEPDNFYSEVSASVGWFGLPWNTAVTLSGAMGQGTQDSGFVAVHAQPEHLRSMRCRGRTSTATSA